MTWVAAHVFSLKSPRPQAKDPADPMSGNHKSGPACYLGTSGKWVSMSSRTVLVVNVWLLLKGVIPHATATSISSPVATEVS